MQLEAAQMLCTAIWVDKFLGFIPRKVTPEEKKILDEIARPERELSVESRTILPYLPTHINHPCTIWTRSSIDNFEWVYNYIDALNSESRFRSGRIANHKSFTVAQNLPETSNLQGVGLTTRPLSMPDAYKIENDPISSYRIYYKNDKAAIASWKNRGIPDWWDYV